MAPCPHVSREAHKGDHKPELINKIKKINEKVDINISNGIFDFTISQWFCLFMDCWITLKMLLKKLKFV